MILKTWRKADDGPSDAECDGRWRHYVPPLTFCENVDIFAEFARKLSRKNVEFLRHRVRLDFCFFK